MVREVNSNSFRERVYPDAIVLFLWNVDCTLCIFEEKRVKALCTGKKSKLLELFYLLGEMHKCIHQIREHPLILTVLTKLLIPQKLLEEAFDLVYKIVRVSRFIYAVHIVPEVMVYPPCVSLRVSVFFSAV